MDIPLGQQEQDAGQGQESGVLRLTCVWESVTPRIAEARDAVTALLARTGLSARHVSAQNARLVVSELLTNAVQHAPGPCALRLEVHPCDRTLHICVSDTSARLPLLRPRDPRRVGGHGLRLVTCLSNRFQARQHGRGKEITALLAL